MSEWFKELVLKTSDTERYRGFESHLLRHSNGLLKKESIGMAGRETGGQRRKIMTFKEAALNYYNNFDMNCAEAVLHGANDVLGLGLKDEDYKLVGAFGSGCGCGSICGAVAAGVAVIGIMNIADKAHGSDASKKAAKFIREIKKRHGSEQCKDLKAKYHDPANRCSITVSVIAEVLDDMREELNIM